MAATFAATLASRTRAAAPAYRVEPGDAVRGIDAALTAGAGAVGLAWPVDPEVVAAARSHALYVMAYTVNEPAIIRAAARAGVDAIITDDPAAARRALSAEPDTGDAEQERALAA